MIRPPKNEYAEYYHKYIRQLPDGDICEILASQLDETIKLLAQIDEVQANHRYAAGKWSLKDVVAHIVDTERVFAYRALCFARNDSGPFPSMEQDNFVRFGNFANRSLKSIVDEYRFLRQSNIVLFRSFDDEISMRKGIASGTEMTVRAIAYIIAGHERHHVSVIQEKYL
ncbi:MAG: DinB family protein [Deferribacteres bacterium]|nr:DinB family protein [candidate division KSB1 bacterium]MCB9501112.1 DinB family protein [Deferribacteres bacterium]